MYMCTSLSFSFFFLFYLGDPSFFQKWTPDWDVKIRQADSGRVVKTPHLTLFPPWPHFHNLSIIHRFNFVIVISTQFLLSELCAQCYPRCSSLTNCNRILSIFSDHLYSWLPFFCAQLKFFICVSNWEWQCYFYYFIEMKSAKIERNTKKFWIWTVLASKASARIG